MWEVEEGFFHWKTSNLKSQLALRNYKCKKLNFCEFTRFIIRVNQMEQSKQKIRVGRSRSTPKKCCFSFSGTREPLLWTFFTLWWKGFSASFNVWCTGQSDLEGILWVNFPGVCLCHHIKNCAWLSNWQTNAMSLIFKGVWEVKKDWSSRLRWVGSNFNVLI